MNNGQQQQRSFRRQRGNQGGQQNNQATINYRGVTINPGSRRGNTRQNYIKRKKLQVKIQNGQGGNRQRPSGNSQSNFRQPPTGNTNTQIGIRGGQTFSGLINRGGNVLDAEKARDLGDYLAVLLDPMMAPRAARIPTYIPYPTAIITFDYSGTVNANASGEIALALHPQAGVEGQYREYLHIYNDATYTTGNAYVQSVTTATNVGVRNDYLTGIQMMKLRVVGAGMTTKYIGRADAKQGYFISAFCPKGAIRGPGAVPTDNNGAGFANGLYRGFGPQFLRSLEYKTETTLDHVQEVTWIPRDDIDMDFMDWTGVRDTSQCIIAGFGLPANATLNYHVKIHLEYIPDPTDKVITTANVHSVPDVETYISDVISQVPELLTTQEDGTNLHNRIKSGVHQTAKHVSDWTAKVAAEYLAMQTPNAFANYPNKKTVTFADVVDVKGAQDIY